MAAQNQPATYHWVITLNALNGDVTTVEGTYNPSPGTNRQDAYLTIYRNVTESLGPDFVNACVTHWSLDRNEL
ncbi:hypothetical protein ACFW81_23705 [Streptomyces angustmyceticus]|uniref:hypothetical protein n=1 Tax=Streptomyces angustmyceticus TaxID=285578 RepID=UPI0036A21D67